MTTIFGYLNLLDTDRILNNSVPQTVIYDALNKWLSEKEAEKDLAYSIFVEEKTELFMERYALAGGGYMQEIPAEQKPDSVKTGGYWDVAYPLKNWADGITISNIAMAKMTVAKFESQILTVRNRSVNVMRRELLRALLYKEQESFVDPEHSSALLIEPLANGDSVVYPPLPGTASPAIRNRYVGSNYTAASISDTNNPYATISAALNADFGAQQGSASVVTFINSAQSAKTRLLSDFIPVRDNGVIPGAMSDTLTNIPTGLPGIVIGRAGGCWIVEWDFIPANYNLSVHLDAPAPLKLRHDPVADGLGTGELRLVAEENEHPFKSSYWQMRFGLGCGNRLNGYAMQLVASTTYTSPVIS